jgi:hypothetical protein
VGCGKNRTSPEGAKESAVYPESLTLGQHFHGSRMIRVPFANGIFSLVRKKVCRFFLD